ncbi:MAG: dienelactone hydrolase [Planctomycetota bacterium]|jgi:dienelactone hydrolase
MQISRLLSALFVASVCSIFATTSAAAPTLGPQSAEDTGPFPVGVANYTFVDAGSGDTIIATLYYPAQSAGTNAPPDSASGPYPLVGFQHGWLGTPNDYDNLSIHIASWGFFVASIGTETSFFGTMQAEAEDTGRLLREMDAQSDDGGSMWFGMISDDPWSAVGHSMGGGACFYLLGEEPRVRVLVPLQPYTGPALGGFNGAAGLLAAFDGDLLIVGGEIDSTAPVATMAYPTYLGAMSTARRVYWEVEGMGHLGPTDFPPFNEPLSNSEQQRMHRKLVAGFLRAEVLGEENVHVELLGEGKDDEPFERLEVIARDPIHWSAASEFSMSTLVVGIAGQPGDPAFLIASLGTSSIQTAFGLLGVDLNPGVSVILLGAPLGATAIQEVAVPLDSALSGVTVYTQGLDLDGSPGVLTRTAAYLVP